MSVCIKACFPSGLWCMNSIVYSILVGLIRAHAWHVLGCMNTMVYPLPVGWVRIRDFHLYHV